MNEIVIERDVPVPLGRAKVSRFSDVLKRMNAGDSFTLPEDDRNYLQQTISQLKRRNAEYADFVFTVRRQEGHMIRCWRIA
jgi:hypothetical protein